MSASTESRSTRPSTDSPDWFAGMHERLDAIEHAADELRKRDRRPDRISPAAALLIEGIRDGPITPHMSKSP